MAGIYAFAKAMQLDMLLESAGQLVGLEKIPIDFEIKDFGDVGRLFVAIATHFSAAGKRDETRLCHKVFEEITQWNIADQRTYG